MNFIYKKFQEPLRKFIMQGASPKKLAISIALGVAIGLVPIFGITTTVLAILAFIFRLNLVVIQISHYLVLPVQIALVIPFYKLGQWIFGEEVLPLTITHIKNAIRDDFYLFIKDFGVATLYALAVWFVFAIVLFWIIYFSTLPYLYRLVRVYKVRKHKKTHKPRILKGFNK